jgi:ABC-type oligopeptide transport system ATPase subunit
MLELDGVTKVFKTGMLGKGTTTAVSDVSFAVRSGEVVSLIGESGSGKTTVGRMILRLTGTTAGVITFDGRDVSGLGRRELHRYYAHVQGVFQDPFSSYNPVYKVDRVLGMIRSSYLPGLSASDWKKQLSKSLEAVSLEPTDVLGKYPHQLSGGQLQRLMIARALVLDIKFLVADEIISMLDASTRIDVLNLLGDLKARGVGILFITHDLSLGNYISDKTLILRRGRVVEMGATEKVYGNPAHPYTRMLLMSVPHLTERWEAGTHAASAADEDGDAPLRQLEDEHFAAIRGDT